jgi:hypothetical protein
MQNDTTALPTKLGIQGTQDRSIPRPPRAAAPAALGQPALLHQLHARSQASAVPLLVSCVESRLFVTQRW